MTAADHPRHIRTVTGTEAEPGETLRYQTSTLTAAADELAARAPHPEPAARRRPADDAGDRDVVAALTAFYTTHDRALRAVTADHRASAEHLRRTASAYTHADTATSTLFDSDRPPGRPGSPDGGPRRGGQAGQ